MWLMLVNFDLKILNRDVCVCLVLKTLLLCEFGHLVSLFVRKNYNVVLNVYICLCVFYYC